MFKDESFIQLPDAPVELQNRTTRAWAAPIEIDTYDPAEASIYPAYLDRRVYQGSSGRIYPMPFIEKIDDEKHARQWMAIHLENEYVRLMILPELGGRIHHATDKTTGYDFFYKNNVMKPALVGVLGPWISGGVEFNWPQHHRPATYLPTDWHIEEKDDGSITVWCSDHDPFARMKGMHGITLRPGSAIIELEAKLYNRTDDVQTFLWWANVAAEVHDDYQAFFPTDMNVVADHAKRAVTTYPQATVPYYGIDYSKRVSEENPEADHIDWYKNIPVPTSYMCLGTEDDFFGGYDHREKAGFIYWSDRHFAPGKKLWTWGNSDFGHAWDRNLTDTEGPYIELMAGAFTDNQPDFSFLLPGETKTFHQYWYPIQEIGVAHQANLEAAVHFNIEQTTNGQTEATIGVSVTKPHDQIDISLLVDDQPIWSTTTPCQPGTPRVDTINLAELGPVADSVVLTDGTVDATRFTVLVCDGETEVIRWSPRPEKTDGELPPLAQEAPFPEEIDSVEELYLTGLHLEQYRHPTRLPEPYWEEALRREPTDVRSATALAARLVRRGQLAAAKELLQRALSQLTFRNPNPYDSEAYYRLGHLLSLQAEYGADGESTPTEVSQSALDALYKAAWDRSWAAPAFTEAARINLRLGHNEAALADAEKAQLAEPEHKQARALAAIAARRLGQEWQTYLVDADPLDWFAADLLGGQLTEDPQTLVDLGLEYLSVGEMEQARRVFSLALSAEEKHHVGGTPTIAAIAKYYLAKAAADTDADYKALLAEASQADTRWAFPVRLQDALLLQWAAAERPEDATAHALLGHWLYGRDRHQDALDQWTLAAETTADPVTLRNIAVAEVNLHGNLEAAAARYEEAIAASPTDSKLWFERDQLAVFSGESTESRLQRLEQVRDLIEERDDLTVQYARLLVLAGRQFEAIDLLAGRQFHPWEGGEGQVLAAWEMAQIAAANQLADSDPERARTHIDAAITPPHSLGEARHPLANMAELLLTLGNIQAAQGDKTGARQSWQQAADQEGDFLNMSVAAYSMKSIYSAMALNKLGLDDQARQLLAQIVDYAETLAKTPGKIPYFATSLPTMLLFHTDLDRENQLTGAELKHAAQQLQAKLQ